MLLLEELGRLPWHALALHCCFLQDELPAAALIEHPAQINLLFSEKKRNCICIASCHLQRHHAITLISCLPCGEKDPLDCFLSVHIFWACFPVGRAPLAPPDLVSSDSSPSFTYFPAALLQCATAGLQTEAPRQTGTVHSELDGLSLSKEEIETDYRITVLTISISLPPGNPTKVSDLYRLLSTQCGGQLNWMLFAKSFNKRGLSQASYLDVVRQRSSTELSLTNIRHIALII